MRIPPGAQVNLTTAISLAAVGLATWLGTEAGPAVAYRPWWILGAVAASVTAAGVPAYEQIRKERLRARAQQAAVDAEVAMQVTMNDALDPIVRQMLMVDALDTGGIRRTDVPLIRLLAGALA